MIASQTCKPAPTQMKVFKEDPTKSNPDKNVYLDFAVKLTKGSPVDLRLSALGKNDPLNPQVYPKTLKVGKDKEQRFSIDYKCKKLLEIGTYYDTVRVVADSYGEKAVFEYLIICDANQMRAFDVNFLVLFAIAIGIIVLAIKTPPLLIFKDMTTEEQEQTELKLS